MWQETTQGIRVIQFEHTYTGNNYLYETRTRTWIYISIVIIYLSLGCNPSIPVCVLVTERDTNKAYLFLIRKKNRGPTAMLCIMWIEANNLSDRAPALLWLDNVSLHWRAMLLVAQSTHTLWSNLISWDTKHRGLETQWLWYHL